MIIEVPGYDPERLPERARHKDCGLHRIQRIPIKNLDTHDAKASYCSRRKPQPRETRRMQSAACSEKSRNENHSVAIYPATSPLR